MTENNFINIASDIHNNKYDYSMVDYINSHKKVKIICKEHGIFEQSPYHHLQRQECSKCSGKYKYTTEEYISRVDTIHNNKYDYSLVDYINNYTKIKILCKKHGIFEQSPISHASGIGCPICCESKGEIKISQILKSNNIKYLRQYKFIGCRNKNELKFDFYLLDKHTCIEFDGEQHFIEKEQWGGYKSLEYIQTNDKIKNEYCKNNNIRLIRLKYNENIEEKLNSILFQ